MTFDLDEDVRFEREQDAAGTEPNPSSYRPTVARDAAWEAWRDRFATERSSLLDALTSVLGDPYTETAS